MWYSLCLFTCSLLTLAEFMYCFCLMLWWDITCVSELLHTALQWVTLPHPLHAFYICWAVNALTYITVAALAVFGLLPQLIAIKSLLWWVLLVCVGCSCLLWLLCVFMASKSLASFKLTSIVVCDRWAPGHLAHIILGCLLLCWYLPMLWVLILFLLW